MISDFAFSSDKHKGDTPISCDLKLFVLFDARKWRYATDSFESYLGRENPAYIYEFDARALLAKFSEAPKNPNLPDLKRWLMFQMRGSAVTMDPVTFERIDNPDSEMAMEIWDNESPVDVAGTIKGNWRSITPGPNDQILYMDPKQEIDCTGLSTVSIDTARLVVTLNTAQHGLLAGDYVGFANLPSDSMVPAPPEYFRITLVNGANITLDKAYNLSFGDLKVRAFYAPVFINDAEYYEYGDEEVRSPYSKMKKAIDLIGGRRGLIDYFKFADAVPNGNHIQSITCDSVSGEVAGSRHFDVDDFPSGSGMVGGGYCEFKGIGMLSAHTVLGQDDYHIKNNIFDLTRDSSFAIGFGLSVQNTEQEQKIFTIGIANLCIDVSFYSDGWIFQLLMTIKNPGHADVVVESPSLSSYSNYTEEGVYPFIFSKDGSVISIKMGLGAAITYIMPVDGFEIMNESCYIGFGNQIGSNYWYRIHKLYFFNKPIATLDEFNGYYNATNPFLVDGANDIDRYIDDNNKVYIRTRIKLASANPTSKLTVDKDALPLNPWTDSFDRTKIIRTELPMKLGVDYVRAKST
jgi:hypothetical protein